MTENLDASNLPSAGNDVTSNGVLESIGEFFSGIPKVFQKPLAKAISRLAMSAVGWPAAAMEAKAAELKHDQAMREKIRTAMVKQAISQIPGNSDIADRALEFFAGDILGKQHNREKVLFHAAEELSQTVHIDDSNYTNGKEKEIDDDWLTSLSRYAENATSERLQHLFGRVLAGEIKTPGTYSLFTLDLLSKLSEKDAKAITSIAPYVISDSVLLTPITKNALNFSTASHLAAIGVINPTSTGAIPAKKRLNFRNDLTIDGQPSIVFSLQRHALVMRSTKAQEVLLDCNVLTWTGQEILTLHSTDPSEEMLKELSKSLHENGITLILGDLVKADEHIIEWQNGRLISP